MSTAVADRRFKTIAGHSTAHAAAPSMTFADLIGRVLVVDDNPRARQSMADALLAAGHEVVAAASAIEGLRLTGQQHFDVI
ncbi:MAG: hypothetical protein L0211_12290, partial [Planctomycetaceae bacterium]|nr:hypothetical protein [Planctomycetaceae bacterium]